MLHSLDIKSKFLIVTAFLTVDLKQFLYYKLQVWVSPYQILRA